MVLSLIAAVSENNVIGRNNELPWHLPADMKFFKDKTMGHCVVMGRKNFDSIPDKYRPLSGRTNIVITRNTHIHFDGAVKAHSLHEAIQIAKEKNESECFIIGGGEIFKHAIDVGDRIYLTRIHHHFEGDVHFPEVDQKKWKQVSIQEFQPDEKNKYGFSIITLDRIR